jgi:hypothetical protein
MENYNIETYYKNIDKPVIDNYANDLNLKNLLALSTITDLYLFTKKKKKNEWKLKDKRKLLKECDIKRKQTIKEVSTSLNVLSKNKSTNLVKEIKIKNNTLLNKIENIDSIIETIENIYPTVSDLSLIHI